MVSIAFLLGARHLWEVVANKPASSLVVSLGKALNGTPQLYVKDRWPRHHGNKQLPSECGHVCMYVLHLFLANKTRATQKNASKRQPQIGNSNKRCTLRRTTFTNKTHNESN